MDHGAWLGSTVFDGARACEGVAPDLDRHCQRLVDSAHAMGLKPEHSAAELLDLCQDGRGRFAKDEPCCMTRAVAGQRYSSLPYACRVHK